MNWAIDYVVDYDYLKIMGIPLKSGRSLPHKTMSTRLAWLSLTRF